MRHRYSGIETSYRCMQKFKLDYIDKAPSDGLPSVALHFGTGLHMALQASIEGENPHVAFALYWESLEKTLRHEGFLYRDLAYKGGEFLRKFEKMHKKHIEPVHVEHTLTGKIHGIEFEGTPDLLCLYKGVPSVLDFKTSQTPYLREKIVCNPQMPLYAELAKTIGFKAEQVVYMVFVKATASIQEPIILSLSEQVLTTAIQSVIVKARELDEAKEFPKNFTACITGSRLCDRFTRCYGAKE